MLRSRSISPTSVFSTGTPVQVLTILAICSSVTSWVGSKLCVEFDPQLRIGCQHPLCQGFHHVGFRILGTGEYLQEEAPLQKRIRRLGFEHQNEKFCQFMIR